MTPTLAAILAWLALQFAIGLWASRRIASEDDYLVAGRQLGFPLATFSVFATWFGAETIIGSAGLTLRDGLSLASAEPFGYGLAVIAMGLVYAVPLWRRQLTTMADLYRQRFSVGVERLAAVMLIPPSLFWAAAQVRAFGTVLSTAAPTIDVSTGIGIAAVFTLAYTMVGGLLADAITDLVQGAMLIVGLVLVTGAVVVALGGIGGIAEALAAGRAARDAAAAASGHALAPPGALELLERWAIPIGGSVIAPELASRVIAARSPAVAQRSTLTAGVMYIGIGLLPVFLGLVAAPLVPGLADPEQLLPTLARDLLPTIGYAIFAGGLISAILSTVDSTLLVASGLASHNLLVPMLGVTRERTRLRLARGGVLLFGLLAYLLALRAEGVFALVAQASSFGSGVLVAVTFGLFTSWGGARTAAATLVTGMASYLAALALASTAPFLLSLGVALATYVAGAVLEGRRPPLSPAREMR